MPPPTFHWKYRKTTSSNDLTGETEKQYGPIQIVLLILKKSNIYDPEETETSVKIFIKIRLEKHSTTIRSWKNLRILKSSKR